MFTPIRGTIDMDKGAVFLSGKRVAWLRDIIILKGNKL